MARARRLAYTRRKLLRYGARVAAAVGLGGAAPREALGAPAAQPAKPAAPAASAGAWRKVRDLTVYGNYGGPAIVGPVRKATFQGFAGGPAFSDDSRYVFVPTQEGDTGIIRIDTQSKEQNVLSYACNNAVYTNPRKCAQFDGHVACNNTITPVVQVLNAATMATANSHWPVSMAGVSQAVQIDGAFVYFAHDGAPGTLTATAIQTGVTYTVRAPDTWRGVYGMEIDRMNKRLVCCDNQTYALYLFDLAPLAAQRPAAPTLLGKLPQQHVGVAAGNRLYAGNGNVIQAYDITTPTSPRPLGGGALFQAPARATGYGALKLDRAHNLLYATWGDTKQSGTDVLAIGPSDALHLVTAIPGWTQSGPGGSISCPANDTAISPDGTKFALSSEGGGGGNGGTIIYDVSKVAAGGQATVLQVCYANAETRQATIVAGDSAEYVYTSCRYSYAVHDPHDALMAAGSLGTLIGSRLQPFGTTAGGTDPMLRIAPGAASSAYDYVFRCQGGAMTPLVCYGDSTLVNTAWDGKYLTAIVNANGWFKIIAYAVGPAPSYALTPVATYAGPFGTQETSGLLVDGRHGMPGSVVWASDSALGVMAFNIGTLGSIEPITAGDIPDRLAAVLRPPTITAASGGGLETPFTYRVMVAYFDRHEVCCGLSGLSNAVLLTPPNNALIVADLPAAPPAAVTMSVYGQFQYTTSPHIYGPSPVTGAGGLPVSTTTVKVASQHVGWFGSPPNITAGGLLPAAGGICEIRKASNRIYVSQGDLGIRVYNPATMRRTGQITATGDPTPTNNPLAAPGIDVYTDSHGTQWLMSPNYTASGAHHGLVALNTTANPDNPPATFLPVPSGGFTCQTYRTATGDKGVLAATLCGAVAFERA